MTSLHYSFKHSWRENQPLGEPIFQGQGLFFQFQAKQETNLKTLQTCNLHLIVIKPDSVTPSEHYESSNLISEFWITWAWNWDIIETMDISKSSVVSGHHNRYNSIDTLNRMACGIRLSLFAPKPFADDKFECLTKFL